MVQIKSTLVSLIKRTGLSLVALLVVSASLTTVLTASASALSIDASNDCDDNAVIYCGADSTSQLIAKYNTGDGHNKLGSIRTIYNHFGISSSDVRALNSTAVAGFVVRDGRVIVGDKVVATNATTAGRQNIAGSTKISENNISYYTRTPSVSFRSDKLPAYVVMKDGVFQFAIIANCANPVVATPTAKPAPAPKPVPVPKPTGTPNDSIEKLVALKGSTNFQKSVTAKQGDHVIYKITIKSTGTAAVDVNTLKDTLPQDVTYVSNSIALVGIPGLGETGYPLGDEFAAELFGQGLELGAGEPGDEISLVFEAIVGPAGVCAPHSIDNLVTVVAVSVPTRTATATVNEVCNTVVTTTTSVTPIKTTPVAKALPNTGPGAIAGLFAGVVAISSFAFRSLTMRRLVRG
ncbi:MAG: hypothetical protein ABIV43_03545 [Candidatus Saccharimonadales bacterium]